MRKRLQIWIACCAMLFSALTPALAQLMHGASAQRGWIEVCSVQGTRLVAADQPGPGRSPLDTLLHHMEHCPYCVGVANTPPAPGLSVVPYQAAGSHALYPALYYDAPAPLLSWSQAYPRAPPARA